MNWIQRGYQHELYVDSAGLIVGEVEYRPGRNEVDASVRQPVHRGIGSYITLDKAKAAVERAIADGVREALSDERILHLWDTHVAYETNPNRPKQPPLTSKDKLAFARAVLSASSPSVQNSTNGVGGPLAGQEKSSNAELIAGAAPAKESPQTAIAKSLALRPLLETARDLRAHEGLRLACNELAEHVRSYGAALVAAGRDWGRLG